MRLAADLAAGRIDAGLLPTLAFARDPGFLLLPGPVIASRGRVDSVRLFCRVPLARVRRIDCDADSMTSVGLLRILCDRVFRIRPRFLGQGTRAARSADAALRIGDAGMRAPRYACAEVRDLGEEWTRWTGLPFVWAAWTARRDGATPELRAAVRALARGASARARAIARREARRTGFPPAVVRTYLARRIRYRLGPRERAGLDRFFLEAHRLGLVPRRRRPETA